MHLISLPHERGYRKKKSNLQTLSLFVPREPIFIYEDMLKTDILNPDMRLVQWSLDSGFEA